jgi:uncharacterized caspase-like protein
MAAIIRFLLILLCLFTVLPDANAARWALITGNDDYESVQKLKNATADADAMAAALGKAGYSVTIVKNRTLKQMKDDVREFKKKIRGGDEVVVFYAGHGVQIGAMNYLLPKDVRAESEDQVRDDSLALSRILEDLREQRPALTLAIIDACRDNPFRRIGHSIGGQGLTGVGGWNGQMVIYSAGEGQQALDRLSDNDPVKNGIFTRVFVREMEKVGVTVDDVAKNVREEVYRLARSARHTQVPAIYDQVLGSFYFHAPDSTTALQSEHDSLTAELKSKQQELQTLQASISHAKAQQAEMESQKSALIQKKGEIENVKASLENTRMQHEELDRQKKILLQKQNELNAIQAAIGASERKTVELEAKKQALLAKQEELTRVENSLRDQEASVKAARQINSQTEVKPYNTRSKPLIVPSF